MDLYFEISDRLTPLCTGLAQTCLKESLTVHVRSDWLKKPHRAGDISLLSYLNSQLLSLNNSLFRNYIA